MTPGGAVPRRKRFNTVEWAIVVVGVISAVEWLVITAIFTHRAMQLAPVPDAPLAQMLEARYGPTRYSEDREEWIVRDFFQDVRGGVFVDIGASHYQLASNTYLLETRLGWSGLAVDALEEFAEDYRVHRPKTTFVARFVSDAANQEATIYVPQQSNNRRTSADRSFAERSGASIEAKQVPKTTLDQLLDAHRIARIDFLSMDIELAEPKALAGFSIDRFRPRLVCIEAHPEVRQQILDYFHAHDYVLVGKYLRIDNDNYWFAPAGSRR